MEQLQKSSSLHHLAAIFEKNRASLEKRAKSLCGNKLRRLGLDEQDIVQEAWLRLAEVQLVNEHQEERYLIGAILGTIARIVIDMSRAAQSKKRGGELYFVQLEKIDASDYRYECYANYSMSRGELIEAVESQLTDRQRKVLDLTCYQGYTCAEAALILEVSERTIDAERGAIRKAILSSYSDQANRDRG